MKNLPILGLVLLALLCGCGKEEIDLATLTTNPFDPDYNGTPIFTLEEQSTTATTVGGQSVLRLDLTVRVHTELFGRPTSYSVRAVRTSDGSTQEFPLNAQSGDRIEVSEAGVSPGDVRCWRFHVGNAGVYGGGNDVCGTAE